MTRDLRLVVFDVDGTLVDSQNHILSAMRRAFDALGVALPPREEVLSIVGLSLPEAMARLVPDLPCDRRDGLVEAYKDSFGALRAETLAPLYPGATDALAALRSQDEVILGVATGKSRRGLDHILRAHGLENSFVTQQVADDHPSKPHPSMLLAACAETGAAPGVMIGDTSFDIEMGRAAGFATIGVSWGYHRAEALVAAGAGQVIDAFDALLPALDRIWEIA